MTDPARHAPLAAAAARRRGDARQRTQQALQDLHRTGAPISFATVARAADVSRKFLYSQPDLREHIERARAAQADAPRSTVPLRERASDTSVRARLRAALEENQRLRDDNAQLRQEIAVLHGMLREARLRGPRAA